MLIRITCVKYHYFKAFNYMQKKILVLEIFETIQLCVNRTFSVRLQYLKLQGREKKGSFKICYLQTFRLQIIYI